MSKAEDVKACFGDGTNNTDWIAYSVTTAGSGSGRVDPIPRGFYGNWVRIISVGADSRYFITNNSGASIDPSVTPTATGQQGANKGELLAAGVEKHIEIPYAKDGSVTYFLARASTGAPSSLELTKASGRPGITASED